MHSYLLYLSKKIKPGGNGFFHHSHIGAFREPETGELTVENQHWRATNMTGGIFREYCNEVGLTCISQEIIGWGGEILTDCFSLFTKEAHKTCHDTVILENKDFMQEAYRLRQIATLFKPAQMPGRSAKGKETLLGKVKRIWPMR